jgi:hypothetical protein
LSKRTVSIVVSADIPEGLPFHRFVSDALSQHAVYIGSYSPSRDGVHRISVDDVCAEIHWMEGDIQERIKEGLAEIDRQKESHRRALKFTELAYETQAQKKRKPVKKRVSPQGVSPGALLKAWPA